MYKVDKSAEAAYKALVRQLPQIKSLFVMPYRLAPDYMSRLKESPGAERIFEQARSLRAKHGIPFWDAVILEAMTAGPIEEFILEGALYHQSMSGPLLEVSRSDVLGPGIAATVEKAGVPYPWAVLSRACTEGGGDYHFPMLDIRCSISDANLTSLERVADRLFDCPWALIESECSYHLIGASLLTERDLDKFFGKAMLFGPLVDRNYIAHQLINGCAALRIINPKGKNGLRTRATTFPTHVWDDESQSRPSTKGPV